MESYVDLYRKLKYALLTRKILTLLKICCYETSAYSFSVTDNPNIIKHKDTVKMSKRKAEEHFNQGVKRLKQIL